MDIAVEKLIARIVSKLDSLSSDAHAVAISIAAFLSVEEADDVLSIICGQKELGALRSKYGHRLEPLAILPDELSAIFVLDQQTFYGGEIHNRNAAELIDRSAPLSAIRTAFEEALRNTLTVPRKATAWKNPIVQLTTIFTLYTSDDTQLCTTYLGEVMRTDQRRLALLQTEMQDNRTVNYVELTQMIQYLADAIVH